MKKCKASPFGGRRWAVRVAWAMGLCAAQAGCEDLMSGVGCDTSAAAGVTVVVRLGDGGEQSCVAAVTITDGTVTETLQAIGHPCQYAGAYERTGKWTITAKQKGYQPATQTGVRP